MRRILSQIKQYKKDTILTPFYAMLEVVMEVLLPYIMARIIDKGIEKGDMQAVLLYGGLMAAAAMVSLFSGIMSGVHGAKASTGFACNLREEIYRKIQGFSFSNIDKFSTAGLVTRMTTDVTNIQNAFQMCIRIAVRAPFMLISSMFMSFLVSPRMSSMFLVALVILGVALGLVVRFAMKTFSEAFHKYDELNASVQENVSAIRVVKAYVREDYEKQKFRKASGNLYNMFVKAESIVALNNPVMMLVSYSAIIAISWLGAHMIVGGTLSTGELTSLFSYIFSAFISLMMLSFIFVMISMSTASIKRISEVLDEVPDLANKPQTVSEMKDGSIDFENVNFAYFKGENKDVLHNIDLHIKSGETIGIIGPTGCGKTSLVNLISRLYDVTSGSVKVGGIDVRDYDMEYLRDNVSVVLQKNVLFSGTILNNIRFARPEATTMEVIRAAKMANAHDFICKTPDGYNTYVGEKGYNLSGGERQRIAIARAILNDPRILILDEATASLDTESEYLIQTALNRLTAGKTTFAIAHRLSTLKNADRLVVIDGHSIAEVGTHNELMEKKGIYYGLVTAQLEMQGTPGSEAIA